MKLHFHLSHLYLYNKIMESDGLKLISFFEDYDETVQNFDFNSTKKEKKYIADLDISPEKKTLMIKESDFITEFFNDKTTNTKKKI